MNILREHLSAWAIVAMLAGVLVTVWDGLSPADHRDNAASACFDPADRTALVQLPRGTSWQPDAALAGLPQGGDVIAAYELAEARNLARYKGARMSPPRVAGGVSPTAMC